MNPFAAEILPRMKALVDGLRSKGWTELDVNGAPALDFVFTVCGAGR